MNITRLKSGSYRIRQDHNGKTYSVTVPYKPSKREATDLINEKINNSVDKIMTFEKAAVQYINAKDNVLSPSTLRGYDSVRRSVPEWFNKQDITEIDTFQVQRLVNEYAASHSPKTVRNLHSFVLAVIRLFIPEVNISTTLPQKVRKEPYAPSKEDISKLFEYTKGSEYYVAFKLAALSLRCSEICALTLDDLDGDNLTIDKALVPGIDGLTLKPTPKTDSSNRVIVIPHDLAEYIREQGYIYRQHPNSIDRYLSKTLKKLGIPHFGIHTLRHFFASYAHDLGYSDAVIQSIGGWSSDHIMKSVYRHAMREDEAKKSMAKDFNF